MNPPSEESLNMSSSIFVSRKEALCISELMWMKNPVESECDVLPFYHTLLINIVLTGRVHSTAPGCTKWPWSSSGSDAIFPVSAHLQQEAGCHSSPCCSLLWTSWYVHPSGKDMFNKCVLTIMLQQDEWSGKGIYSSGNKQEICTKL